MTVSIEQFDRLENRVNDLSTNVNRLDGAYQHLATKEDVARLQTDIEALKSWVLWRVVIAAAIVQGVIAAGIKYLP